MPELVGLEPCRRGYHVARIDQLTDWLGPAIWLCEVAGERVEEVHKVVVGRARLLSRTLWDDRRAWLFAADLAEHVVHLFEVAHPGDVRPRRAIERAREYAHGRATMRAAEEAAEAARRAAMEATRPGPWAAAWAAARAGSEEAAEYAPWRAARDVAKAARDATRAAVPERGETRGAAWFAEGVWQAGRLYRYLHDPVEESE